MKLPTVFQIFVFVLSFGFSFVFYLIYSHYYHRLPKLKCRWIELFPSIKIYISGRIIHLHHWFSFLIILTVSIIIDKGILASTFAKGFLSGGIIQGVSLADRGVLKKETTNELPTKVD
ncbi:hypothetical protein KKB40_00370 [Patescibacteria group bacterium]|nr:hypothetical protein [Patescibacteria group bacterium]